MKNLLYKAVEILEAAVYKSEILKESKARTVDGYVSPEPGDLPEKGIEILAATYASCRKDGGDKESCSKIAWGAVHNAGY